MELSEKDFKILSAAHKDFMIKLINSIEEWQKAVQDTSLRDKNAALMHLIDSTTGYMVKLIASMVNVIHITVFDIVMKMTRKHLISPRDSYEKTH